MKKTKTTKQRPASKAFPAPMSEPTREDIAAAAHATWEQEGRPEGRDVEHWLKAETELRQGQRPS